MTGTRGGYPGGGMSLPRPYSATSGGNLQQNRGMHDSADRIAAMYGTLRGPMRRPHSTVGGTSGEYLGRDGGHCEQRQHNNAATYNDANASQFSPSDQQQQQKPGEDTEALKQSVQEQLQQLVRELEEGDDSTVEVSQATGQRPRGWGAANRPLYSSNPALHLTCTIADTRQPAGLVRDQKSVSNADLSSAETVMSEPHHAVGTTSSSTMLHDAGISSLRNRKTSAYSIAPSDGYKTPVESGRGSTFRDREGSLRRMSSPRGEWMRRDSSAAETFRRMQGRGGLNMHHYQRGKSEDLRHALDSLARTDPQKTRSVTSLANSNLQGGYAVNMVDSSSGQLQDGGGNTCTIDQYNNNANQSTKTLPRRLNTPTVTVNNIKDQNNSGIATSRSSTGIPVRTTGSSTSSTASSSGSSVLRGPRSSFAGMNHTPNSTITNNNNNIPKSNSESLQPKVYQKSKSRELTPTIEAAGEKFSQLNSGTLKRISPFEAYRRTKSRELPLDHATTNRSSNKDSPAFSRLKSPPPQQTQANHERPTSPFEKAKSSIEKKCDVTKSPAVECDTVGMTRENQAGAAVQDSCSTPSSSLSHTPNKTKSEKMKEVSSPTVAKVNCRDPQVVKTTEPVPAKSQKTEDKAEKNENDKDITKVKKAPSSESEKPKSMYKMIASRFNRSGSNVSESSRAAAVAEKRGEEDEGGEKEEKFRLKRPSRFLKPRTEKSASKSSMFEGDDDLEKQDKKPSKKLTDALNKFLGRKDSSREEIRTSNHSAKSTASSKATPDEDQPRKPPRAKTKQSSSQENLCPNQTEEDSEVRRAQSVVPEAAHTSAHGPASTQPNCTLESVTKSICNHLSQLESDITSRIGNMGTQEQRGGGVRPSGSSSTTTSNRASTSGPSISTYGLSPALANRRNGRPTNLDEAAGNMEGSQQLGRVPSIPPTGKTSGTATTTKNSTRVNTPRTTSEKVRTVRRPQEVADSPQSPSEINEDQRCQSEAEDESVMDRITRKSYYSKFQDKRPKLRRANTKEDMDQQLAAAKARLMKEEREALGNLRLSSSRSPQGWETPRKNSRKSLPPEDAAALLQQSGRRGASLQPDDLMGTLPPGSFLPGDPAAHPRLPSLPPEDYHHYPRAPSVPMENYHPRGAKLKSNPPEDHLISPYSHRASSVVPQDYSARSSAATSPTGDPHSPPPYSDGERMQDAMTAAVAAGSLAGEVAADGALQKGDGRSHELPASQLKNPEPGSAEDSRTQAREELSRRLTHLTRLSGGSGGIGTWGRGVPREGEQRPYRRTSTTGRLAGEITVGGPPVYRRTNTMDLPPADARARPGSEYRRQLQQDPARRYSAARWVS